MITTSTTSTPTVHGDRTCHTCKGLCSTGAYRTTYGQRKLYFCSVSCVHAHYHIKEFTLLTTMIEQVNVVQPSPDQPKRKRMYTTVRTDSAEDKIATLRTLGQDIAACAVRDFCLAVGIPIDDDTIAQRTAEFTKYYNQ